MIPIFLTNMLFFNVAYEEEKTKFEKDEEDIQDIDGFNFKNLLTEVINKLQQQYNEETGGVVVNEEDLSNTSVANFAQGMTGVFAAYNVEDAMIDDVFTCLSIFSLVLIGQLQIHVKMLLRMI